MKGFRCTPTSAELQAVPNGTTVEAGATDHPSAASPPPLTIREAEVSPGFSDMCCARWRGEIKGHRWRSDRRFGVRWEQVTPTRGAS
jgi:hypothetical protein